MGGRLRRAPDVVLRPIAGQRLLIDPRGMPPGVMLFLLDGPVAELLWEALATPRLVEELVDLVVGEFAVAREVAEGDVGRFLAELRAERCVEDVGGGPLR